MSLSRRIAFVESNTTGSGFQALQIAHEYGLHVTFFTHNPEKYLRVPGTDAIFARYVDDLIVCPTSDSPSILQAIEERGNPHFDAFFTIGEYHVPIAAEVAHHLGLPGLHPQAAWIARNKLRTRTQCQRMGIASPRFFCAATEEDVLHAARDLGFPCVMKPLDEAGSLDVALCTNAEEAIHHFHKILATPVNFQGQARQACVLIEEYLLGYEVSIETVTDQGHTHVIGVTDKHLASTPYFVEIGHTFPSCLPEPIIEACSVMAVQALKAIGFDFGPAHIEIKMTEDGPKLIEINARAAGDHIPDLIELSLGIPLMREIIRLNLGEVPDLDVRHRRGAAIRFFSSTPGVVKAYYGLELAKRVPGVVDIFCKVHPGDTIQPITYSLFRPGYVIATAETSYLAGRLAETALSQIIICKE